MDENFVKNIFHTVLGESVQVKVIRDRNSGYVPITLILLSLCPEHPLTITEMPATASWSLTLLRPPRRLSS
jgi:hypothetical protein